MKTQAIDCNGNDKVICMNWEHLKHTVELLIEPDVLSWIYNWIACESFITCARNKKTGKKIER